MSSCVLGSALYVSVSVSMLASGFSYFRFGWFFSDWEMRGSLENCLKCFKILWDTLEYFRNFFNDIKYLKKLKMVQNAK
jgi:hypothetical protein